MSEFIKEVDVASAALKAHTNNCISVAAGCELFTRYVTRTASDSTEVPDRLGLMAADRVALH